MEEMLTRLVEQHQMALLRLCYMLLQDTTLAEDAVQETFIKAYRALPKFRGECSDKTWLTRIAVNTCRDIKRSGWFRYMDRRMEPERCPNQVAEQDDTTACLSEAIRALPQKEKEVILLHYYQGLTEKDVAKVLGVATSTVCYRLKRGREKLRCALERGWADE